MEVPNLFFGVPQAYVILEEIIAKVDVNRVHLENCSSFRMNRKTLIPQPLLAILPEAKPETSPSPK
ncbi:hypothetical protein [Nostoc sp.]|uniref:hypothetical protein n=1 Tax=Nostoc sp. TaxID=1180 RepID=UPI002FFB0934